MSRQQPRIGLALSGGAVRGAAHVGVLKVLDANGIRPHCIAGTSAGAMVGAAYAAGQAPERLQEIFAAQSWPKLVRPSLHLREAVFDIGRGEALLRETLGLETFDRLQIPFAAVCCDIANGEAVAVGDGDLVQAVMASAAIPGLFPARELDGRLLVDGGVVDNLPVDVARQTGADIVIGVDLLEVPSDSQLSGPLTLFESWQRSLYFLIKKNHPPPGLADYTIVPEIAALSFTDFDDVPELIRRGEAAARRSLEDLQRLIGS